MDDPKDKENPPQPAEPAAADNDPINASGHYFFKRYDREPAPTDPKPDSVSEPALENGIESDLADVSAALQQPAAPGDGPARPALTITFQSWATPVVGLAMLVLGLLGGYFLRPLIVPGPAGASNPDQTSTTNTQTQSSPEQRAALMEALIPGVRHYLGDPEAPITLIEFSDFQCPFCGRFTADAGRQIRDEYVESGEVRLGYVHFAFLGPESLWAAEASECAADQDRFWEYHDHLFANQNGENQGAFNKDILKGFALALGLNSDEFDSCLDSGKYTQTVQNETQWAQSVGVQSTPTFVVNGFPVIGAQPITVFEEVFNTVLTP